MSFSAPASEPRSSRSCTHRWVFPVSPGLAGTQTPHVWPQSIDRNVSQPGFVWCFPHAQPRGVDLGSRISSWLTGLSTVKLTVFPLPYSILWKALLSPAYLQVREKRTDAHSLCVDIHLLQNICRKDSSFPQWIIMTSSSKLSWSRMNESFSGLAVLFHQLTTRLCSSPCHAILVTVHSP